MTFQSTRPAGFQVRLRPYRESDAGELLELFRRTVREVNSRDYSPRQIEAWASDEVTESAWAKRFADRFTVVAEMDGHPVGFAELEPDGHIDRFFVASNSQGKGIGGMLMAAIVKEARHRGLESLRLESSITAKAFFERQQFRTVCSQSVTLRGAVFTNFRMCRDISRP